VIDWKCQQALCPVNFMRGRLTTGFNINELLQHPTPFVAYVVFTRRYHRWTVRDCVRCPSMCLAFVRCMSEVCPTYVRRTVKVGRNAGPSGGPSGGRRTWLLQNVNLLDCPADGPVLFSHDPVRRWIRWRIRDIKHVLYPGLNNGPDVKCSHNDTVRRTVPLCEHHIRRRSRRSQFNQTHM
jgi:hypothetical protein